jgi:hypothetical protein
MKLLFTHVFILTLFVNIIPQHIIAQNPIPNPGFEEWSGGEPVDWNTINQSIFGTSFICITRDQTNPQSGSSCVKIQTVTHNIILVGPVTMPGIISLGEITLDILNQTGTVSGGVPIDTLPEMLKGWFRYLPGAGDSCILGIGLFRWNGTGRDTLATSYTVIGGQHPDWQEFTVPIDYLIWAKPDTMNIMFFSSNLLTGSPVNGSQLWIDNLSLEYSPVGTGNVASESKPGIRYGEDGRSVLINVEKNASRISIFGMSGVCLKDYIPDTGQTEIPVNIADLKPGIYLARIINQDGSSSSLKFIRH